MKVRPILRVTDFGEDVAEFDDELDSYFVETSSFYDVVTDRADLILGPKGSGKSAIFRQLINRDVAISELEDIDIVPAFNPQGAVIFRQLMISEVDSAAEHLLRSAWLSYMLALVGNHIIDQYSASIDTRLLDETLKRSGLRVPTGRPRSLWKLIVGALKPSALETSLTLSPDGIPELGARLEYGDEEISTDGPSDDSTARPVIEFEDLLSMEVSLFQQLERRCWIVFDRLDEAFQDKRELERVALRGLLRAHLDICSYGKVVRPKLFLRTDLLDRITDQSGFVNATHVRSHRIAWDEPSLVDLVARRTVKNAAFTQAFGISAKDVMSPEAKTMAILKLLPAEVDGMEAIPWIIRHVTDGTKELNPRNVLTFLRSARKHELIICDREDPDFEVRNSLISQAAMWKAFEEVSEVRLQDTMYAEFNHLRRFIERLRGKVWHYNTGGLAHAIGLEKGTPEFASTQADLIYSGFLEKEPSGRLIIPLLYRPALNIQRQYVPKLTDQKQQRASRSRAAREGRKRKGQGAAQQTAQPKPQRQARGRPGRKGP